MKSLMIPILATFLVSTSGWAQRANEMDKGVRVRVTRIEGSRVVGAYLGSDADSISLRDEHARTGRQSVALSDVSKIEVSNERRRGKNALVKGAIGLGMGAISGAILGAITYSEPQPPSCNGLDCGWGCLFLCSREATAGFAGALGGAAGLLAGTFYRLATGREVWTAVSDGPGR